MAVVVTFTSSQGSSGYSFNPITITSVPIGTAAADRLVFVVCQENTTTVVSMTIGGIAAIEVVGAASTTLSDKTQVFWAAVPTGTTANIVITSTGDPSLGLAVFSVTGADTTTPVPSVNGSASLAKTSTGHIEVTLDVPADGAAIAGICGHGTRGGLSSTWTNATEVQDASGPPAQSAASITTASLLSSYTITDTFSGTISTMAMSAVALQSSGGPPPTVAASAPLFMLMGIGH